MTKELQYLPAFILHTRKYKENQLLMEMLVAGEGRMSVIGYKGSKKNTGRTAMMQPFRALIVQFKKDSGLRSLKSIDENQSLSHQLSSLSGKALFCGFYLNELVCRLCSADAQYDELYPLYVYAIKNLADLSALRSQSSDDSWSMMESVYLEWTLRQFEHKLLQLLGYGISFSHELDMQQELSEGLHYQLFSDQGFKIDANKPSSISGKLLLSLNNKLEQTLSKHEFVPKENQELSTLKDELRIAKQVLRVCLHRHLGDKPLKSRELFRK